MHRGSYCAWRTRGERLRICFASFALLCLVLKGIGDEEVQQDKLEQVVVRSMQVRKGAEQD